MHETDSGRALAGIGLTAVQLGHSPATAWNRVFALGPVVVIMGFGAAYTGLVGRPLARWVRWSIWTLNALSVSLVFISFTVLVSGRDLTEKGFATAGVCNHMQ